MLGGLCQPTTATVQIYVCVWLCARMWVSDMAQFKSPGCTFLSLRSMHDNASATFKIDDQRLCRSGQNDAADIHRGTLTDNGRQGEAEQSGAIMVKQKQKNSQEKGSRRWTDGQARHWREYTIRKKDEKNSQSFLILVFLSYASILCLLITHCISVWLLYSCQS